MPYCKLGETPIVRYKFPEKEEMTYKTKDAPIEINVRETKLTGYMPGAYQADYWVDAYIGTGGSLSQSEHYVPTPPGGNATLFNVAPKLYYPPFVYPIVINSSPGNYKIKVEHRDTNGNKIENFFNLIGASERGYDTKGEMQFKVRDVKWIREDGKTEIYKWEIEIVDKKGKVFKDYGIDKPTFRVQCGKCPDGFLECKKVGYPGYYCMPCSEIKSELVAARLAVRSLKNG